MAAHNSCRTWPLGRLCLTYLTWSTNGSGEHSGRYNTFVKKPWMDEDGSIIWNHWRTLAAKATRGGSCNRSFSQPAIATPSAAPLWGWILCDRLWSPFPTTSGHSLLHDGFLGQVGSCIWIRLMLHHVCSCFFCWMSLGSLGPAILNPQMVGVPISGPGRPSQHFLQPFWPTSSCTMSPLDSMCWYGLHLRI